MEPSFNQVSATSRLNLHELEKCLGTDNVRALNATQLLSVVQARVKESIFKKAAADTDSDAIIEQHVKQKLASLREENIYLRNQNFVLDKQMNKMSTELSKLQLSLGSQKKDGKRLALDQQKLTDELRFYRFKAGQLGFGQPLSSKNNNTRHKIQPKGVSPPPQPQADGRSAEILEEVDKILAQAAKGEEKFGRRPVAQKEELTGMELTRVRRQHEPTLIDMFSVRRAPKK